MAALRHPPRRRSQHLTKRGRKEVTGCNRKPEPITSQYATRRTRTAKPRLYYKGVYWLSIAKGSKNIAGYVGQAGGERGFDQRFNGSTGYVKRGIKPVYLKSGELGCTSKNARRMLDALDDKQTVSVFVIDDPALADDTLRRAVEKHLTGQLCRTGVLVWNKRHIIMPSATATEGSRKTTPDEHHQDAGERVCDQGSHRAEDARTQGCC